MGYYLTERGGSADEVTIVLGGELDLRAAPALRDALERAIEAGVKHVIAGPDGGHLRRLHCGRHAPRGVGGDPRLGRPSHPDLHEQECPEDG